MVNQLFITNFLDIVICRKLILLLSVLTFSPIWSLIELFALTQEQNLWLWQAQSLVL